jgi:hypothetical protein
MLAQLRAESARRAWLAADQDRRGRAGPQPTDDGRRGKTVTLLARARLSVEVIPANAAANRAKRVKLRSLYDCDQLCGRGGTCPGDRERRAAHRCALPDFDRRAWLDVEADDMAIVLAQEVGDLLAGRSDEPWDLDVDGCPQAAQGAGARTVYCFHLPALFRAARGG